MWDIFGHAVGPAGLAAMGLGFLAVGFMVLGWAESDNLGDKR